MNFTSILRRKFEEMSENILPNKSIERYTGRMRRFWYDKVRRMNLNDVNDDALLV